MERRVAGQRQRMLLQARDDIQVISGGLDIVVLAELEKLKRS